MLFRSAAPLAIVMGLALLYAGFAEHPQVAAALRGMGAVTAGLIAAVALKALQARTPDQIGWLMLFSTFVLVGLMRWPLVWVMLGLGALSVALVWRKERRR